MKFKSKILDPQIIRIDEAGWGFFTSNRNSQKHRSLDLLAKKGAKIFSPIDAKIIRKFYTEAGDGTLLPALELAWSDCGDNYLMGVCYIKPEKLSGNVKAGELIGRALGMTKHYKDKRMKNHIHVQLKKNGVFIDVVPLLNEMIYC